MSVGKKRVPRFRVGDPVMFLYGPQKVAGEIVEDRGPLGQFGRRIYRVSINRGQDDATSFEIPEEDIERSDKPTNHVDSPGLRQEFDVTYVRQKKSNEWKARTNCGRLYRGIKASGAVGYTTGRWEGEREENHATVSVFLECDQTACDGDSPLTSSAWATMRADARKLADRMFMSRHPGALIEHEEDGD